MYTQNIDGWDFTFTSDTSITARNDEKIGSSCCFHIHGRINPNNIERDIKESRVVINKTIVSDIIPGKFPDETEVEKKMEPFIPEVKKHLIEFCKRFVEKANG